MQAKSTTNHQDEAIDGLLQQYVEEQYQTRRKAGESEEEARAAVAKAFFATGGIESAGVGQIKVNLYCVTGVNLYFQGVHGTPNIGVFYGFGPGLLTVPPEQLIGKECRYTFILTPGGFPMPIAANVSWFSMNMGPRANWTAVGTGSPTGGIPGYGTGTFTRTN